MLLFQYEQMFKGVKIADVQHIKQKQERFVEVLKLADNFLVETGFIAGTGRGTSKFTSWCFHFLC